MDKEKKKFLQRRAAWFFLRIFMVLNGKLPLRFSYLLGKVLGTCAYIVVRRHRNIALDSLFVAFPHLSLPERKKIARNFFIFMAQGSFELFYFLKNPHRLEKAVCLEGKEYLEQALAKTKGVIILTAHLGNFPLLSLRLAKEGYVTNFVIRPLRDEKAGEYIHNLRTQAGVKTIFSYPRDVCVREITRTLKNNELVLMQMDQNFGTGGVWVKFFGTLAATPVGPIMFALRTKAVIVPAYIYRKEFGVHCIRILPSVPLTITDDRNETILLNAIRFTRIIETWIKEWPQQWGWIHRRWKSRPSQKVMQMEFKIEQ